MTDKDRLIELISQAKENEFINLLYTDITAIADYLLANGVRVPPCKVGDMVYKINGNRIEKFKVARFIISSYGISAEDLYGVQVVLIDDFSKTVFLTKEEAEAKLKELRNGTT